MGAMASQITSLMIVYSTVYSDADQRKHQSSASLAFVRGIHRGPVNSPHKWPATRKMSPFDDVIARAHVSWDILYMYIPSLPFTLKVVCRQLGYPYGQGFREAYYGSGEGPILMDEVYCTGEESSLIDCPFKGWGNNDCSHAEDAAVVCDCKNTDGTHLCRIWLYDMGMISALLTFCDGYPSVTGGIHSQMASNSECWWFWC